MSGTRTAAIRISTEDVTLARQRLEALGPAGDAALRKVADAGAKAAASGAALGQSTQNAAYQMRALAQQMPDVVQGLLTGQNAFQLLIQQGGQVAQVTGGVGAAFRALVGYMGGPYVAAGLAAGAALGVLAARSSDLINEQRQLDVALRGVGRTAELSAAQLATYVRALEKQGVARDAARGIAADIARTQGLSASSGGAVARLAPDLAAALGTEAPEAAKRLIDAFSGGYDAVKKLDDALNFLTADQQKQIRTMLEHGERTKALDVATEALTKQIGGLHKDALTPSALAFQEMRTGWSQFMDAVAQSRPIIALVQGLGSAVKTMAADINGRPEPTTEQKIAELEGNLTAKNAMGGPFLNEEGRRRTQAQLAELRSRQAYERTALPTTTARPGAALDANEGLPSAAVAAAQRGAKIIEEEAAAIAKRDAILRAGIPDRVRLEALDKARVEGQAKGLAGTQLEAYAQQRAAAAVREASDAAVQAQVAISREGRAALDLAAASEQGRAAMLRATAAAQAHEQAATQTGVSEKALAEAILNRNAAQENAKGAEAVAQLREQVAVTEALIAAEAQGPRAAYYAAIDEKVRAATVSLRAARDATTDPAIGAALEKTIRLTEDEIRELEKKQTVLQANREINADKNALELLQKEIELVGQSTTVREREMAILRAKQTIEGRGGDRNNLTADDQDYIRSKQRLPEVSSELRRQQALYDEVANVAQRAFDQVGDAITQAFVQGNGAAINFGNVAKGVLSAVVQAALKLVVVNPLINAFMGSDKLPSAWDATGSVSGGGFSLGSLSSIGNNISRWLSPGQSTNDALGAMGGVYGPASLAQLQAFGGGGLFGGAGATFGSLLGGAGAGFGAGMFLNSLLGGNQTGGMVGSGVGAAAGAVLGSIIPGIGTLLGGILGGAAGGGLGGLFGPGESVRGFGLRLQSNAYNEATGGTNDYGSALLPIDYRFYNQSGKAFFQEAEQQVAATNAYLNQRNLRVSGASIIGGNKNGPDYASADAGSVGEGFTRLRFAAVDNAQLDAQLRQRNFTGVDKLAQWVDGFLAAQAEIDKLGTAPLAAFTQQVDAINAAFDKAIETARQYGLAEDKLSVERARQIAALEAQRAETLRQSSVDLALRRQAAGSGGLDYDLARQTEAARRELDAFGKQLDSFALSAADKAARLVDLEETQAAERAAIIQRYGEQAAQALRTAGSQIRTYLDSLATGTAAGASPTDRLAAAQTAFTRDRTLALGGDRDALGRITSTADALLGAGRDVYASGSGFQAILQQVTSGLSSLPVVQSYDAMQAASLAAIQQALTTGTLNTQTVILQTGNIVQLAGGLDLSAVVTALGTTNATLANIIATQIAVATQTNAGLGNIIDTLVNSGTGTVGTLVSGLGMLATGMDVANRLQAAANDNALKIGAVLQAGQDVLVTTMLNGLGVVAQTTAGTATASASGLAVVAQNIATHAAAAAASSAAAATIATDASAAQVTALAGIRADTQAARAYLSFIDNTGKVQANYLIAANDHLVAGNTIAAQAAKDATLVGNALNTITASGTSSVVSALNAANTIEASGVTSIVTAQNATNTLLGAANTTLAYSNSYLSFIDNTAKVQANYAIEQTNELRGLRQEVSDLKAALAAVVQAIQQGAVAVATETRGAGTRVATAVEDTTAAVKKIAA